MSALAICGHGTALALVRKVPAADICSAAKTLMMFQRRLSCVGRIGCHRFLHSVHNSRQLDREGRSATGLAFDRDVPAHHLAEPPADDEPKTSATVFARRGG